MPNLKLAKHCAIALCVCNQYRSSAPNLKVANNYIQKTDSPNLKPTKFSHYTVIWYYKEGREVVVYTVHEQSTRVSLYDRGVPVPFPTHHPCSSTYSTRNLSAEAYGAIYVSNAYVASEKKIKELTITLQA